MATSSAWLAREFGVDPRTIAAALRPYGVRPGEVEPGVRGYVTAELAGIVFVVEDEDEDLLDHFQRTAVPGWGTADVATDWRIVPGAEVSAVDRLSAGAGHDMTPALKAAGLLL